MLDITEYAETQRARPSGRRDIVSNVLNHLLPPALKVASFEAGQGQQKNPVTVMVSVPLRSSVHQKYSQLVVEACSKSWRAMLRAFKSARDEMEAAFDEQRQAASRMAKLVAAAAVGEGDRAEATVGDNHHLRVGLASPFRKRLRKNQV